MNFRRGWWGLWVVCLAGSGAGAGGYSRAAKELLVREAESFFKAGHFEAAREKWTEALALASRAEARRWRPWIGRAYEREGNYQQALSVYQEAYDADSRNVDRWVDLARLYDAVEIDDQATRFYEEAHRRNRSRRDVALALARLYQEAGRLTEAKSLAEVGVRAEPRDASAQELLAQIEESQGDLAEAARRRENLLSFRSTAEDQLFVGRLWAKQRADEQADRAFVRAQRAGAAVSEVGFERAALAWRRGKSADAAERLSEVDAVAPADFAAGFLRALLALTDGDRQTAGAVLSRLPATTPETRRWKDLLQSAFVARLGSRRP